MINPNNIIGKIYSIKESTYKVEIHLGEIKRGIRQTSETEAGDKYIIFDDKRNVIEENTYNSDGSLQTKWTSIYDENGNEIEGVNICYKTQIKRFDNDKIKIENNKKHLEINSILTFTISYNEKGNRVEYKKYNNEKILVFKETYSYDENDNEIEIKGYNLDDVVNDKETYLYDKNGNEIESKLYDSDNNCYYKSFYKYDLKGNLIEMNSFDEDDKKSSSSSATYYKNGKESEMWEYNFIDGLLSQKRFFRFDKFGNEIEFIDYNKEVIMKKTTSKYDDNGNILVKSITNNNGILESNRHYEYEFDKIGNWIKRVEYENGIPIFLKEIEIKYQN